LIGAILCFLAVFFTDHTLYDFYDLFSFYPWKSLVKNSPPHNLLITDPVNVLYPLHFIYKSGISNDSMIPLWNNYIYSGTAQYPYSSPAYFILFSLFKLTVAHDILLLIHLAGAALFSFLYLRKINISKFPSAFGSIAWMLNGYVLVWLEFENAPMIAFSLPAMLFFVERLMAKRSNKNILGMVITTSMAISVAYAHLLIYQLLFVGFYILARLAKEIIGDEKKTNKDFLKLIAAFAFIFSVSFAVNAVFFFNHISMARGSQRKTFNFSQLYEKTGQLPSKYLATLIYPDLFGNPADKFAITPRKGGQPYNNYNELCIYSGVIVLIFSLIAVFCCAKNYLCWFYSLSALSVLLMAMGAIIYYPFARFIPGLNLSTPTRILYIFGFCVSVLSAFGMQVLINSDNPKKRIVAVCTGIVSAAVLIALFIHTDSGLDWLWKPKEMINSATLNFLNRYYSWHSATILKQLVLVGLSVLVCLALLFYKKDKKSFFLYIACIILIYDMGSFGLKYNTISPRNLEYPETPAIRFLKAQRGRFRVVTFGSFLHNGLLPFGIEDIGGYSSFYPNRYAEYIFLAQYGKSQQEPEHFSRWMSVKRFGSPMLDLLNVKYLLFPPKTAIHSPQLKKIYDKDIAIYLNKRCFDRVFFVPDYDYCKTNEELQQKIISYSIKDFRGKVLLEELPYSSALLKSLGKIDNSIDENIEIVKYTFNEVKIVANVRQDGFIVMSDNYHPDWQVTCNDKKVKLYRGNYVMRAVPIRSGKNIIKMTFKPEFIISGMWISFAGWIILFILLCIVVTQSIFSTLRKRNGQQRRGDN
jgi:hypothetical protein